MKILRKIGILCLLLGILFLTGCGIQIKTDMTVDEAFKGSRTITCYISNQDLRLHFQGDSTKIDSILENHCPGCLEYEKKNTDTGIQCTFTLSFSSLEDYKTQLSSILNFSPQVEYKGIHSFFSDSFYLSENFTSIDLLRWLEILLTDEYAITENQLEKLWDIQDTTVSWMDQNYILSEPQIQVSDQTCNAFDGISIYTEEKEDRTFVRRIQFSIPRETLDTQKIELEQKFESIKPEETTGIWTTTASGRIYELTFQAEDFKALSAKTALALDTAAKDPESRISISDNHYLSLHLEYSETLDFSRFLSTEDGKVPVTYYFKPNSMTEINSEEIQKEINNAFVPKQYEDDYYKIYSGNCASLNIRTPGILYFPVSSYSVQTTLLQKDRLKRVLRFSFEDVLRDEEKSLLQSALKSNSSSSLSLKLKETDGSIALSITQKGSLDEINDTSLLLFGDGNEMTEVHPHLSNLFSRKNHYDFIDSVNLTSFLGQNANEISGTYCFEDKIAITEDFYLEADHAQIHYPDTSSSENASAEITGTEFHVYYFGSNPSYTGFVIVLLLALLILALFLWQKGIFSTWRTMLKRS